jgi:hypothetical protein
MKIICGIVMTAALLVSAPSRPARADSSIPWFEKINFSETEALLQNSEVASVKGLKNGTTDGVSLVTFQDGTKAVWKPGQENLAEVAGYRAARSVGSSLVPPTVERELFGRVGSLQLFVRVSLDITNPTERPKIWEKVPAEQKAERNIFNFVFGNWDLHWGNVLVDDSYSIVQIDNGAINRRQMVRYGELPFIRRLDVKDGVQSEANTFPFESAVYLEKPSILGVIEALEKYVTRADLAEYVSVRLKKFKNMTPEIRESFRGLIRNGADAVELAHFIDDHKEIFSPSDLSMRIAVWDGAVWIQAIGFQNYKPIAVGDVPARVISAYRELTFTSLRQVFPKAIFDDKWIQEALARRDQILNRPTAPGNR